MRAKKIDRIAKAVIYTMVFLIILLIAFILGFILTRGIPHISLSFLTEAPKDLEAGGGIGPEIFNSFYLLLITLIISVPVSFFAAVYLVEYAPKNMFTQAIRIAIEVLSSLPSIVVGLFGFLFFVIKLKLSFSIISGACALMIFNLPILVRVMENSLAAVDPIQQEAALGLGVTKWEAATKVLLPWAMPGIVTGVILSAGRIFGEAAALIYTAGQTTPALDFTSLNFLSPNNPWNIFRPAETLAVHIWKINSEGIVPDASAISNGSAAVLVIAILFFNIMARIVGKMVYRKMTSNS